MICFLAAVKEEILPILSLFSIEKCLNFKGKPVWVGKYKKEDLIFGQMGIGIVNAAHLSTVLLEKFPINLVFIVGCAGGFPEKNLNIGDIVLAEEEVLADAIFPFYQKFSLDLEKIILKIPSSFHFKKGLFLTVSSTTKDKNRLKELKNLYPQAICENMEGASVVQICKIYSVPCIEIRGISNIVGEYNKKNWNIELAVKNCKSFIKELIEKLC